MNKRSGKQLMICLSVILTLCCIIVLISATNAPSAPDISEDEAVAVKKGNEGSEIYIIPKEAGALQRLTIIPSDDKPFSLYAKDVETEKSGEFLIEGMELLSTDSYAMNNLIRGVRTLRLVKNLGEQRDLSQYGLDEPITSVKALYENREEISFDIGNTAPSGGNYILYRNDVYVGENTSWASVRCLALLDKTIISLPVMNMDAQMNKVPIAQLTILNTNISEPVSIKLNPDKAGLYSYLIERPIKTFGNDDVINNILESLEELNADSIIAIADENTELSEYGLDNPQNVLTITIKDYDTHVLKVGDNTNVGRYLMVDDRKLIYLVGKDALCAWTEIRGIDLCSPLILVPEISKVSSLSIQTQRESYKFKLDLRDESENRQVIRTDEMEVPIDSFRQFYQKVVGLQIYDIFALEKQGSEYMSIEYRYYDNNKVDKLIFNNIEGNERACIVNLNGELRGLIRKTTLDELIRIIQEISE